MDFLHKLIHWILDHPVPVRMFLLAVSTVGLVCSFIIPVELSPNIFLPRLTVSISLPNASAVTVEARVTAPVESSIQAVKNVARILSTTREGSCTITVWFNRHANLQLAELEISEKIRQLQKKLPEGVSWPRIDRSVPPELTALEGFMTLRLLGRNQDSAEIRRYAEEKLRLPLLSVDGVEDVNIWGGGEDVVYVDFDPQALDRFKVTGSELQDLQSKFDLISRSVGTMLNHGTSKNINLNMGLKNLEEIKSIPIKNLESGRIIRLRDIAAVRIGHTAPRRFVRIDGKNLVTVYITKEAGANLLKTADRVNRRLDVLKRGLPDNLELFKEADISRRLRSELANLTNRSRVSVLGISAVLLCIYWRIKTVFLILSSILLSLLGTVSLFFLAGYNLNALSLAGLTVGLGVVVDNGIVVYDGIHSRVSAFQEAIEPNGPTLKEAVVRGVKDLAHPLLASNLTTLCAFLPFFFLSPDLKVYFGPFVTALGCTLVVSLLVSLLVIPSFAYWSLIEGTNKRIGMKEHALPIHLYKRFLRLCMAYKKSTLFVVIWLFGFPIWLMPERIESKRHEKKRVNEKGRVKDFKAYMALLSQDASSKLQTDDDQKRSELTHQEKNKDPVWIQKYNEWWSNKHFREKVRPYLFEVLGGSSFRFWERVPKSRIFKPPEETFLYVSIEMPNNLDISKIDRVCREIEAQLWSYSDAIRKVTTRVSSKNWASIRIDLGEQIGDIRTTRQMYFHLVDIASGIGGVGISVAGYGSGFHSSLATRISHFSIKVAGYNYNGVLDIALATAEKLKRHNRVREIKIDMTTLWSRELFEIVAAVDHQAMSQYNLSSRAVHDAIRWLIKSPGVSSARTKLNGEWIPIQSGLFGERQTDIQDLRKTVIHNKSTDVQVRVKDVLELTKRAVLPAIQRENQAYTRLINFQYLGSHKHGKRLLDSIIEETELPYGYRMMRNVPVFEREDMHEKLLPIVALAICIVWMVTASLFESWRKPILVILAMPLALIGAFYSFYFFQVPFDTGGYGSLVLLAGIVVNSSILLVHRISAVTETTRTPRRDRIIDAAATRLRPIFTTTVTTLVGLLPLILYEKADSVWYSLAVGTFGGLISSSVLMMIVIPLCFDGFRKNQKI